MGANKFNPESASQQSDGNYRDVDQRTEVTGDLLARVRDEQREFEARINSLTTAVHEYALVLAIIRAERIKRLEERTAFFEEHLQPTRKPNQVSLRGDHIGFTRDNPNSEPENRPIQRRGKSQ